MKKITTLFLAFAMIFTFAACSKDDATDATETTDAAATSTTAEESTSVGATMDFSVAEIEIKAPSIAMPTISNVIEFEFEPIIIRAPSITYSVSEAKTDMNVNVEEFDISKLDTLSEADVLDLAQMKQDFLASLKYAFETAGLNIYINEASGEIAIDSSVLFGGDSAELSEEGKKFLKNFIVTYASIVFCDEFDGFISKINVEGHTAPVAGDTYEDGYPLSVERAEVVKNFCTSAETGLPAEYMEKIDTILSPVGLSNAQPVLDAEGNVDMDASRRVNFRFFINVD